MFKYIISLIFIFFFNNTLFAHDCISFTQAKSILEGYPNNPITVLDDTITLEEAYCAQEKLNYLIKKKYNDKVGYKVGFTGKSLQERFNINTPAIGTIYKHMFASNNTTLSVSYSFNTFIEPDILVVIKDSNIMNAANNIEIMESISSIHPFIEIPTLRFAENKKINGNMLVAANMLAGKMVMAEGIKFANSEEGVEKLSNLNTVLIDKDNKVIQKANTKNLMGNPLNVLKWLIEEFNRKEIILQKGDMVSLGSIGSIFPLEKNTYRYFFEGYENNENVVNITFN